MYRHSKLLVLFLASMALVCIMIAIASKRSQGSIPTEPSLLPQQNTMETTATKLHTYTNPSREITLAFRDPWLLQEAPTGFPVLLQNPWTESSILINDSCLQSVHDYANEISTTPLTEHSSINGAVVKKTLYTVNSGKFIGQVRMIETDFEAHTGKVCAWAVLYPKNYEQDFASVTEIINSIAFPL